MHPCITIAFIIFTPGGDNAFLSWARRLPVAEKKRLPRGNAYDDNTIQSIKEYFRLEDEEHLFRYIKHRMVYSTDDS